MALSRIELILILGLSALVLRVLPQLFLVGKSFPETWDRLLRYLSYALLCGLISITLFMSGARFEAQAAPYRGVALAVTIAIAHKTKTRSRACWLGRCWCCYFRGCGDPAYQRGSFHHEGHEEHEVR